MPCEFLGVDFSTDGIWCYIVLWVFPHSSSPVVRLSNLKNQLQSVCPSCTVSYYFFQQTTPPSSSAVYLLTFVCLDRKGLLHGNNNKSYMSLNCSEVVRTSNLQSNVALTLFLLDVTKILSELELSIQSVKVTTTPDDRVLDLFFVTDNMWVLPWTFLVLWQFEELSLLLLICSYHVKNLPVVYCIVSGKTITWCLQVTWFVEFNKFPTLEKVK